mmetsp:Transcript_25425/g.53204  ORF Transcript_25425/g.53204 Transcript_25425/m.53204 type:complete len:816 (+) Transcript_25425:366-2813(+)
MKNHRFHTLGLILLCACSKSAMAVASPSHHTSIAAMTASILLFPFTSNGNIIPTSSEITCHRAVTTADTASSTSTIPSYGILFTVESPATTNSEGWPTEAEGFLISSIGFYVDLDSLSEWYDERINNNNDDDDHDAVHFEVYTVPGYYAHPSTGLNKSSMSWDYRGNFTYWDKIAEGEVRMEDLREGPIFLDYHNDDGFNSDIFENGPVTSTSTVANLNPTITNYFEIPYEQFTPVMIPSTDTRDTSSKPNTNNNLGANDNEESSDARSVQSFYITLREIPALILHPLESWEEVRDAQTVADCGVIFFGDTNGDADTTIICSNINSTSDHSDNQPIITIGEGVIFYPFYDTAYFYRPRKFVGSIHFNRYVANLVDEEEDNLQDFFVVDSCPTFNPSLQPTKSMEPSTSLHPTPIPSNLPTLKPTKSVSPTPLPSRSNIPSTLRYIDSSGEGCHRFISSDSKYDEIGDDKSVSYGVLFSIRSDKDDSDGVWITSFGFHVAMDNNQELNKGGAQATDIVFEVYALEKEGLYADPNRTDDGSGTPIMFDYRGNFSYWERISNGTVAEGDLTYSYTHHAVDINNNTMPAPDYFQIPWEDFLPTRVPSNGGSRSFYLTLSSPSFVYLDRKRRDSLASDVKTEEMWDDDDVTTSDKQPPVLQLGEGVIGYPFLDAPFLYTKKQFVGKIFYEWDCPSSSPSALPSEAPSLTLLPSSLSSTYPTASGKPSSTPSEMPSKSTEPSLSISPTVNPSPTPSHMPSISSKPSMNPNNTSVPSTEPSSIPSIQPPVGPSPKSCSVMPCHSAVTTFVVVVLCSLCISIY